MAQIFYCAIDSYIRVTKDSEKIAYATEINSVAYSLVSRLSYSLYVYVYINYIDGTRSTMSQEAAEICRIKPIYLP